MGAEREINITEFSDDYYTEPKKKKSKRVKVDNPWESELSTTKSIPKKTHFNSTGIGFREKDSSHVPASSGSMNFNGTDNNITLNSNTLTNTETDFRAFNNPNPWEQNNNFGQWPTQDWQPYTLNTFNTDPNFYNSITIQNNTFMKNKIEFISLVGYKKEDIKVQVVKDQVQITAERDIIDGYDFQKSGLDPADEKPNVEIAVTFNEETHDGKKVKVSFLNGFLRVEIPLREDITTDVEIQ